MPHDDRPLTPGRYGHKSRLDPLPLDHTELNSQDRVAEEIYFIPPSEGVQPHYAFLYVGGPKRYLKLWLEKEYAYGGEETDWSYVLHPSAVLLWKQYEEREQEGQ